MEHEKPKRETNAQKRVRRVIENRQEKAMDDRGWVRVGNIPYLYQHEHKGRPYTISGRTGDGTRQIIHTILEDKPPEYRVENMVIIGRRERMFISPELYREFVNYINKTRKRRSYSFSG